ncbi:MAG: hypothetical protein QOG67_2682 [Verrucomicrobiota bacterium]
MVFLPRVEQSQSGDHDKGEKSSHVCLAASAEPASGLPIAARPTTVLIPA